MTINKILSGTVFLASGLLACASHAGTLSGSGSMTGAEPTMSPRFFRSGTPGGVCSTFSSGTFTYQSIDMNSDATGTMTATFDPGTCGVGIFVTFHSPSFNPANICTNHLWSFGSSLAFSGQSFAVPPNSPIKMIVSGVQNAPNCGPFTYSIDGVGPAVVKTAAENLDAAKSAIDKLSPPDVIGAAQRNMMSTMLGTAKGYLGTPYQGLSLTMLNSLLVRTDGCALRTTPDTVISHGGAGMDWITTCAAQAAVYPLLKNAQTQLMAP